MENYIKIIKALSDITRLKIIWLLTNIDEKICVSEIVEVLEEHQYKVSRHLRVLKDASLIYEEKEGKLVFYYLVAPKDEFQFLLKKAISVIPKSEMNTEMIRCKRLLDTRNK